MLRGVLLAFALALVVCLLLARTCAYVDLFEECRATKGTLVEGADGRLHCLRGLT